MTSGHLLRIGELSKRAGVSPELLRAWERRFPLTRFCDAARHALDPLAS